MKVKDIMFNIISPPRCMACNCLMNVTSTALFCYDCSKTYKLNNGNTCRVCGKPVGEFADLVCASCKSTRIYYESNVSRYLYRGCIKDAIQNMKFKRRKWIAFEFAKALCETASVHFEGIDFDAVIPVPMTKLDEKTRGFNQSKVFAEIISEHLGVTYDDTVLYKKVGAKTQSGLGRKERLANVKNSYIILEPDRIVDKVVLLVDDVFTTGATMNECARVLKKAGAVAVFGITAATTVFGE